MRSKMRKLFLFPAITVVMLFPIEHFSSSALTLREDAAHHSANTIADTPGDAIMSNLTSQDSDAEATLAAVERFNEAKPARCRCCHGRDDRRLCFREYESIPGRDSYRGAIGCSCVLGKLFQRLPNGALRCRGCHCVKGSLHCTLEIHQNERRETLAHSRRGRVSSPGWEDFREALVREGLVRRYYRHSPFFSCRSSSRSRFVIQSNSMTFHVGGVSSCSCKLEFQQPTMGTIYLLNIGHSTLQALQSHTGLIQAARLPHAERKGKYFEDARGTAIRIAGVLGSAVLCGGLPDTPTQSSGNECV